MASVDPPARKGLPPEAYEVIPGSEYRPYVPASQSMAEFTVKAVVIGILMAVVFGAANAYLGLRVGLTVSASIPAAVMAVAIFRVLRRGTILETNMVQTIGSAGESVAAGVIFTIPALFIWQRTDPTIVVDLLQVAVIAGFGGLLGVLFMIPLRRYLISREHGKLPYPEGTACAEVQVAGDTGGSKARLLFSGLGLGALYQTFANSNGLGLWNEGPYVPLPGKAQIGGDFTPELLGVGFIIGPRIAAIMFGGSALAWLIMIPAINLWGGDSVVYPATVAMSELGSGDIWSYYLRYVGAGAVGCAGIVTLIKSFPTIIESIKLGVGHAGGGAGGEVPRTQQDLPMKLVLGLAALMAVALWLWPGVPVNFLGAILIVIFSFFFVTVSSRIVGLIGSSSNPVSGMTIAALLLTSLIWVALGLNDGGAATKVAVLAVGAVVCISAAAAGDTSQDLKTGFLVGATPRLMQIGEMLGVLACAVTIGFVLIVLNESYGIGTVDGLAAPQATLMSLVIDGVLNASLPWAFVFIGIAARAGGRVRLQAAVAGLRGGRLPAGVADDADPGRWPDAHGADTPVRARGRDGGRGERPGRQARAGRALRLGADRGGGAGRRPDRWSDLRGGRTSRAMRKQRRCGSGARVDGRPRSVRQLGGGNPGLRRALLDALARGHKRVASMRGMRAWCAAAALLVGGAGCEEEGPDTISREVFVETYVALRVAELTESGDDGISAEARERVLAGKGVTEEELLTFADVRGPDVNFMEQLWDDIEERLEEIRNTPDTPDIPG